MLHPHSDHDPGHQSEPLLAWFHRLKDRALPMRPATVSFLRHLNPDSGAAMERLCREVGSDPGAVLALLKAAGTGRGRRAVTPPATAETAAMMIGIQRLRAVGEGAEILDPQCPSREQEYYLGLILRSFQAALHSHRWGCVRGEQVPKESATAALLFDLGELLLALHGGLDALLEIDRKVYGEGLPLDEAQYLILGFSIDQLTELLVQHWGFSELLQDALSAESAQHPRLLGIVLAVRLARLSSRGWHGEELQACIDQVADWLDTDPAAVASEAHQAAVEAARALSFPVAGAAYWLPALPGPMPDEKPTEASDGNAAAEHASEEPPADPANAHVVCLSPQPQILEQCRQRLEHAGGLSLHQVLNLAVRAVHEGIAMNRVVFAVLTPDHGQLQGRYVLGADHDPGFKQFHADVDSTNLFGRLLAKQQSLWLDRHNRDKILPLLPHGFRALIGVEAFFTATVFVDGKPVGLLYADRHGPECQLDEAAYQSFKAIAHVTGQAIARTRDTEQAEHRARVTIASP